MINHPKQKLTLSSESYDMFQQKDMHDEREIGRDNAASSREEFNSIIPKNKRYPIAVPC